MRMVSPDLTPGDVVEDPVTPELIVMPTTCKATFALLMECGHIQFGCGDSGALMARLTLEHREAIRCALCGGWPDRRYIKHVWRVEWPG